MSIMKKNYLWILVSVFMTLTSLFFVGCGSNDPYSNVSLTASSQSISIYVGQTVEYEYTIENYVENMDNAVHFTIVDASASSGSTSSEDDEEIYGEHVSLQVISANRDKIKVAITGVSSGRTSILATTEEGFKKCVVDINVLQFSKTFEVDETKTMYIALNQKIYVSNEYFLFDEGTTERSVKYYDVQEEDADKEGKEFVSLYFYESDGEKVLSFFNAKGESIATKTCAYDGQYFTFVATYTYKETDELGNEVEVSINKLAKIIALYGIDQDDIQIYDDVDNVLQSDADGLKSLDKTSINLELIANKADKNYVVYYVTVPTIKDSLIDFVFSYSCKDKTVVNIEAQDITEDASVEDIYSQLVAKNLLLYRLLIKTDSFTSSQQTEIYFNVHYAFEHGASFDNVYDDSVNYTVDVPVIIKLMPEKVEVVDKNKVILTNNNLGDAGNSEKEIYYNFYVSEYGWIEYYINVYKPSATYSGVKVSFDYTKINIIYDGKTFNSTDSFIVTDLSKPIYIRGVEGVEAGLEDDVVFEVQSELFEEGATLKATLNYAIQDGASKITYNTPSFDAKTGNGIYISSSSTENIFVDLYADKEFKYFVVEAINPGIVSIGNLHMVEGTTFLSMDISPIKVGEANYIVRLDNGVSTTLKVKVVNTFDDLAVALTGTNPDVVSFENNKDLAMVNGVEDYVSLVVRNSGAYGRRATYELLTSYPDSVLEIQEDFDKFGICSIVPATGLVRQIETISKGTIELTLIVHGRGVDDFVLTNNVERRAILNIISFVPVSNVSVHNINPVTSSSSSAEKVVVYSQVAQGEEYDENASNAAYLKVEITPSDAYYFYDIENSQYSGDRPTKEYLYWTLSDGVFAFDTENTARRTDMLIYGKSYYISGRTIFNSRNYYGKFEYDESLNYYKFTANPNYASGAKFTIYASVRQFGLKKYYAVQIECREFVAVEQIYVTDGIDRYAFKSSQKTTYKRASGEFIPKGNYYTTEDGTLFEKVASPSVDDFNEGKYFVTDDKDFQIAEDKLEFAVYLNPYGATVGGVKCLYVTNSGGVDLIDVTRDVLITPLKTTTSKAYLVSVVMRPETVELLSSATTMYAGTLYIVPNDWYNSNYTDLNGVDNSKLNQIISISINFQNGTRANPYVLDDYNDVINVGKDNRSRSAHYVVYNLIDMAKVSSDVYPICAGTTTFTGSIRGGNSNAGFINVRITRARGMFGTIEKAGGAEEDEYSLDNLVFKGSLNLDNNTSGNSSYGLIAGVCTGNVYNIAVEIDENSTIKLTGANGEFDVGLAFGTMKGAIYQDFNRNYIEIGGSLYGSEWFDDTGAMYSKDVPIPPVGDKYFKIGTAKYEILKEKEINGVVTSVAPYIIVEGVEYEIVHISKIMVFSNKKISISATKEAAVLNVGGVAGTLEGKVSRIENPDMSHFNYSNYTVYAHITTYGNSGHNLGGIAGVFEEGLINNVLIGGHIGYAVEFRSTISNVIVGGFAGTMVASKVATLKNSTSRMTVSGYVVGVIVGSINSSGTHTVDNITIQAIDDGVQTGLDASFIRRYCKDINAGAATDPHANDTQLSNLLKGSGDKNLDLTVLNDGELYSYMTSRDKANYYSISGSFCSYVDTTNVIGDNQYYGDAILIRIASANSSLIYAAKNFTPKDAGGVEIFVNPDKEFDTTATDTFSSYVYYFDASAYYGDNGELVYSNIITKQNLLDKTLNVLRKEDGAYFPFTTGGEKSISISSTSSNISIDINGNITLKSTGVAVIDVTSMLNQKNIVKIYLYIINYFDVVSYNNMINGYGGTKTQDLFYVDSLPFRNDTEFRVISEETVNVLLKARMASLVEFNANDKYTILAGGILLLDGENILLDNSNDFIQYDIDFEGNYVKATGDFDSEGTYYTYDPVGLVYNPVAVPDIDEFTAGNYYTFEIFGQVDKYEDGFTYVKKTTADTDRDSIDKFDIHAYMSFVADGEEYTYSLANILGVTAKYFEGATAIDSNYSSYVIISGKEFKDVFSITSDTDEELMLELQNAKGDVLHSNILDDASDAIFKASGQKVTAEGNPNTFKVSLYVNKLSDAFKNRIYENIYGDYYLVAYSTSHGRDGITKTIKVSFEQIDVNTILATSYNDMQAVLAGTGEVESEYVVPKQAGILVVSLAPIDADFDYVLIENGQENYQAGSSEASFIAGYLDESGAEVVFRSLTKVISTPYGIKILKSSLDQIPNFSGTFHVQYLFGSYRTENNSPVSIMCGVYKNSLEEPLCEDNLDLKLNVKYQIGLKLNGYENKTRIARGLTYDVEVMNTGYDANSIMISIPADYVSAIQLISPDGREVDKINIAEIGQNSVCKLKVSNDVINYATPNSNIVKILLEATYTDSLGNIQKESAELELTILEYVINYSFDEDNLEDIVSTMNNGVVTTAIGEKTTLSIDFNNYSLIEFNDQNEGILQEIRNFLASLERNGNWTSYVDVNASGVQVYKNPIVDKSQSIQDRFGFVSGSALTLDNTYFSSYGLSFRPKRTHGISEKHYLFSFNANYKIQNGVYVYDNTGSGEQIYTEFTFDAFIRGSEDHPNPVYDYEDLKEMKQGGHYILLKDIYVTSENFEPIATSVASFDGNGYKFIFSNFEENKSGSNSIYDLSQISEVGIFSSVAEGSVIKNIHVQIGDEYSKDVVFNLSSQATVSLGLVAVINNGVITNACVENYNGVKFIVQNNMNSSSIMGGVVASNESSGFITHSRSFLKYECAFSSGGVVGKNAGVIASSFFKGNILNRIATSTTDIYVGGFAVENTATITTSYTLGDRADINYTSAVDWTNADSYNIDASVQTAGFVYKNNGEKAIVQDCYSNLMISSTSLSAGFVFENNGIVKNAMSYSLIKPTSNRDYGFAGGASAGSFENCYYLRSADFNINKAQDFFSIKGVEIKSIEDDGMGSVINEFNITEANKDKFSTFSFSMGENTNFVWEYRAELGRLELVDANIIAFSQKDLDENATVENEDGTTTYFYQTSENSSADGSKDNPYVISTPEKFESYLAYGSSANRHYRIVCDLDFGDYETNYLSTYDKTFEGVLYGNGMKIINVSLYSDEELEYAGLFGQIVGQGTANACVKDLILMPLQVTFVNSEIVGALAGRISYADIVNVSVYGTTSIEEEKDEGEGEEGEEATDAVENVCVVTGKNIVGGLVGVATDKYTMSNIIAKISSKAKYIETNAIYIIPTDDEKNYLTSYISKISYSGAVVGFLAGYGETNNIYIKKSSLVSIGSSAGLVFGFVGKDATASNINVQISTNMLIRATIYGGIVAGGSYGRMENIRIEGKQDESITLFSKEPYMATAVGGVAGYASGAVINNVYIDQALTMPYTSGLDLGTIDYVGGIVGVVDKENSSQTLIRKINMNGSISAIQTLGGIVGRTEANTTLNLSEIAIQDIELKLEGRTPNPILGSLVGLVSGDVLVQNSYSKAKLIVNAFDYDKGIRLAIGELFGLTGPNEGATFSSSNIKLVENVIVQNSISISLQDKGYTGEVETGKATLYFYEISCKNIFNESGLEDGAEFIFNEVQKTADYKNSVNYTHQKGDIASFAEFGQKMYDESNPLWDVIRDEEDNIIGAELHFIQNS